MSSAGRPDPRSIFAAIALAALAASAARAQPAEGPAALDLDDDALPGTLGTPAVPRRTAIGLALRGGYAAQEALTDTDGAHHRAAGRLALGVAPLPGLGLSLALDGRYDAHPATPDEHAEGHPTLTVRGGVPLDAFGVGVDASVRLLGDGSPAIVPAATSVWTRLYATLSAPTGGGAVAVGVDWDNSRASVGRLDGLTTDERVALGVDATSSLTLSAAGWLDPLPVLRLMLALDTEAWLGDDAPRARAWPWALRAGFRAAPREWLAIGLEASARLSDAPGVAAADPAYTVRPRFAVAVTASFAWPLDVGAAPAEPPERADDALVHRGRVVDEDGAPIDGVEIAVVRDGATIERARTDPRGRFRLRAGQTGDRVRLRHAGRAPLELAWDTFTARGLEVALSPAAIPPPVERGWVRLLVRDEAGRALAGASIRATPGEETVTTDAEGRVEIELAPGAYTIEVAATGHRSQRHSVDVEDRTVVVLNVELRAD